MTKLLVISCFLIGLLAPNRKYKNEIEFSFITDVNDTTFQRKMVGFITINNFPNVKLEFIENNCIYAFELTTLDDNLDYIDEKLKLTRLIFETLNHQSNVTNFKQFKRERYSRQYRSVIINTRITFENEGFYYVAEFEQFGNMLIYCYVTKRKKIENLHIIQESELISVEMKGRFRKKF